MATQTIGELKTALQKAKAVYAPLADRVSAIARGKATVRENETLAGLMSEKKKAVDAINAIELPLRAAEKAARRGKAI